MPAYVAGVALQRRYSGTRADPTVASPSAGTVPARITEATVKTHPSNVFTKVGARSRVEAAMFGYGSGFVRQHWT
ncbi:MAG TPA: LuxR C-terminal-related transcriptional regulator [Propionicimonas sp.]